MFIFYSQLSRLARESDVVACVSVFARSKIDGKLAPFAFLHPLLHWG